MSEDRVASIHSSCGRARSALFVATVVAATVGIAVWNTYFTWSRHWLGLPEEVSGKLGPLKDSQEKFQDLAVQHQVRLFMENKDINLSLLGIRVSSDDVPILGGLALCIISLYEVLALRRANRDIASALIEAQHLGPAEMRGAYFGIRSDLMFNAHKVRERPVDDLDYKFHAAEPEHLSIAWSIRLLVYLPALAILLAIVSDFYYAVAFTGEFDLNFAVPVWSALPLALRVELALLDLAGVLILFLTWRYNRAALAHLTGTFALMSSFARRYHEKFGCSIYDPLKDARQVDAPGAP